MSTLVKEAIEAIHSGRKEKAKQLLTQELKVNPTNDEAWLWMSTVVDTDDLRRDCLEEALKHNPRNKTARKVLAKHYRAKHGVR